jgi:hypothetical protein
MMELADINEYTLDLLVTLKKYKKGLSQVRQILH